MQVVRALTRHSRPFFDSQPEGFCETPVAALFPSLYFAEEESLALLDALEANMASLVDTLEPLDAAALARLCPVLRTGPGAALRGFLDPTGLKLDADALLQSFARKGPARKGRRDPARPSRRGDRAAGRRLGRRRRRFSAHPHQCRRRLVRPDRRARRRRAARARAETPHDHRRRSRHGHDRLAVRAQRRRRFLHARRGRAACSSPRSTRSPTMPATRSRTIMTSPSPPIGSSITRRCR